MKQGLIDISFNRIDHGSKNGLYTSHNELNEFLKEQYFVTKPVLTYRVRNNCSSDQEKRWKFEAEGKEFEISRTNIQTVKGKNCF